MGEFKGSLYRAGLPGQSERRAQAIARGHQETSCSPKNETSPQRAADKAKQDEKPEQARSKISVTLLIVIGAAIILIISGWRRYNSISDASHHYYPTVHGSRN